MAASTDGFREDNLSVASSESMGVQFLGRAVDASMKLHLYRYTHREVYFQRQYPRLATIRQWLHALLETKRRGGRGDTASAGDSDAAGWTTDEGEDEWEARFRDDPPQDPGDESSDEEVDRPLCDDIQVA